MFSGCRQPGSERTKARERTWQAQRRQLDGDTRSGLRRVRDFAFSELSQPLEAAGRVGS
jgi:hypothetical protein